MYGFITATTFSANVAAGGAGGDGGLGADASGAQGANGNASNGGAGGQADGGGGGAGGKGGSGEGGGLFSLGSVSLTGGTATFSCQFIAPETSGSYTDSFQMNNTSGSFFGPAATVQITVSGGNTNQYDRARAVSYANNYAAYVCSDGE